MTAFVGFAAFDTQAESGRTYVGWAQFDAQSSASRAFVGWASFDTQDFQESTDSPLVPGRGGGGDRGGTFTSISKYYSSTRKQYNTPIHNVDESEEEEVIMQILMEVARELF